LYNFRLNATIRFYPDTKWNVQEVINWREWKNQSKSTSRLKKIWPMIRWDRMPEWDEGTKKVEWTSKGEPGVGSTVHVIGEVAGVKGEWDGEVTELIENESRNQIDHVNRV
jgi:hypothetical protein